MLDGLEGASMSFTSPHTLFYAIQSKDGCLKCALSAESIPHYTLHDSGDIVVSFSSFASI